MKVFRIARQQYLEDLTGEGARLYGGRWNKKGHSMLYFSESLSLALLEILVHLDFKYLPEDFGYVEVEIPDRFIQPRLKASKLEPQWRDNPPNNYTINLGTEWLKAEKSLAMRIPSAVLPMVNNILVNPKHKQNSALRIIKTGPLEVDSRLYKDLNSK